MRPGWMTSPSCEEDGAHVESESLPACKHLLASAVAVMRSGWITSPSCQQDGATNMDSESPPEQQDAEPAFKADSVQQFFFKTCDGETRVINPRESWLQEALRSRRMLPSTSPEAHLQAPLEGAEAERQVRSGQRSQLASQSAVPSRRMRALCLDAKSHI